MKSQNVHDQERGSGSGKVATSISEREMLVNEETVELTYEDGERERARSQPEREGERRAPRLAATGGLAVILGQLVAYFHNRAHIDDLDVLSFSLHHLFCRIDYLYETALPRLAGLVQSEAGTGMTGAMGATGQAGSHYLPHAQHVRHRQQVWTQLQTINRTLDRMEPICHLLSDATECILERFDASTDMIGFLEAEAGDEKQDRTTGTDDEEDVMNLVLAMTDAGRWDHAFAAIAGSLLSWQEQYSKLSPFTTHFAPLLQAIPLLPEIDAALATILDSAGAIFGDILPGFRAILDCDEAMIAALLYDLMQQSDHLLVKFDTTLEPMNMLIKYYAVSTSLS
jgi:hypothetical protein